MRRLRVLTWHTHGSYLHYLSHAPHEFYVLSKPGCPPGYGGRCGSMPWRDNLHDLPVEEARRHEFDCILFQDDQWEKDQYAFLTPAQRALPRISLGDGARRTARDRFSIGRFSSDWDAALRHVTGLGAARRESA